MFKNAPENLRVVVESAPYALILIDINGLIKHVNFETEKLYGYKIEEIVGKNFKILMPQKMHVYAEQVMALFFLNPKKVTFGIENDFFAVNKQGDEFFVEVVLTPIITEAEMVLLATVIDITARRANENIIKKQLVELQLKNLELEQFNYIASHDLQEPLRTVSNYIELLKEDYPLQYTGEIKIHLLAMSAATNRMSRLVRSLLDFGKLGRNRMLIPTNCLVVINEVIADLGSLIKSSGAIIKLTSDMPTLLAYDIELHQLFQNLINNAIKFSKKNTCPVIHISCEHTDEFYKFYIKDNGIGIDPLHADRVFNIFQRLHKEEEYDGYGIGLANCRKIIDMHGGNIWVESEIDKGSTFIFTITCKT